ncbi:hypothetical protein SprV_0401697000 [Sparganum proliferum]
MKNTQESNVGHFHSKWKERGELNKVQKAANTTEDGKTIEYTIQNSPQIYGKSVCTSRCSAVVRSGWTCEETIKQLRSVLQSALAELHTLKTENEVLQQSLDSKNHAINILRSQLKATLPGLSNGGLLCSPDVLNEKLTKVNTQLASELEVCKRSFASYKETWDDYFKKLKTENQNLKKELSSLQTQFLDFQRQTIKARPKILKRSDSNEPDTTSALSHAKDADLEVNDSPDLPTVIVCPVHPGEGQQSPCAYASLLRRLLQRLHLFMARAEDQKVRADDLAISVEAYRLALEDQFVRSQGAIEELFRALQTGKKSANYDSRSKSVVERSSSIQYDRFDGQPVDHVTHMRQLLVRWIESTLLSAISSAGIPVGECQSEEALEEACSCDSPTDDLQPVSPSPAGGQLRGSTKSVSSLIASSKFKSVESLPSKASTPSGTKFAPQYRKQTAPTSSLHNRRWNPRSLSVESLNLVPMAAGSDKRNRCEGLCILRKLFTKINEISETLTHITIVTHVTRERNRLPPKALPKRPTMVTTCV